MTGNLKRISYLEARRRRLKFSLKMLLDESPRGYEFFYKIFSGNSEQFFNRRTQLVIDGFPSSGNTFLYRSFLKRVRARLNISHHMHSSAQIRLAFINAAPIMLCLRNPIDAAVSNAARQRISYGRDITSADVWLRYWTAYHRRILKSIDVNAANISICHFEDITGDVDGLIRSVVECHFPKLSVSKGDFDLEVLEEISKHENEMKAGKYTLAALPSDQKMELKESLKHRLLLEAPDMVEEAIKLHDQLRAVR